MQSIWPKSIVQLASRNAVRIRFESDIVAPLFILTRRLWVHWINGDCWVANVGSGVEMPEESPLASRGAVGQYDLRTNRSPRTKDTSIPFLADLSFFHSLNGPPSVAQRSKIKDCRGTPWKGTPPHKCIIYLCHVPVDIYLALCLACLSLFLLSLSPPLFERSPLFLTPCRPFCFVDDFTRVGHVRKISQTMAGFSSKEDSIAISSLDRVERNLRTSVATHSFIFKDYSNLDHALTIDGPTSMIQCLSLPSWFSRERKHHFDIQDLCYI